MSRKSARKRQKQANSYQALEPRKLRAGVSGGEAEIVYLAQEGEPAQIWNVDTSGKEFKINKVGRDDHGVSVSYDSERQILSIDSARSH